jgi:hypothetical protein
MSQRITDDQILQKIGLTDKEVRDAEAKFSDLVKTLDPAQRDTLKRSTPTAEAAAKTLGPEVTAERLLEFIRSHAPHDAAMVICFNGTEAGGRR